MPKQKSKGPAKEEPAKEPHFENVDVRGEQRKPEPEPEPLPEYEQRVGAELRQLRRRHDDQLVIANHARNQIKLAQAELRKLPDVAHRALDDLAAAAPTRLEVAADAWLAKLPSPDPSLPPSAVVALLQLGDKKSVAKLHALIDSAATRPNQGAISTADRAELEAEVARLEGVIAEAKKAELQFPPQIAELQAEATAIRDGRVRGGVRMVSHE